MKNIPLLPFLEDVKKTSEYFQESYKAYFLPTRK